MKVSVVKETAPGERRVALVPEAVVKLRAAGLEVLVESGAGDSAWHTDDSYAEAGASVVSRAEALAADVVLMVGKPDAGALAALRPGQVVIGLLAPLTDPDLAAALAAAGVTALSMDTIPRTIRGRSRWTRCPPRPISPATRQPCWRDRIWAVLSVAHHRRRNGSARPRAGTRHGRGGSAGHRYGPPAGRGGQRL